MAVKGEKLWYIVQTYSGKENSVKDNLLSRIQSMDMTEQIFRVLVPEVEVIEKKADGTEKSKIEKKYPGYVFVEMIDNDDSWWVVRNTPGVTGFLGSAGKKTRPVPMFEDEVKQLLEDCGVVEKHEVAYEVGDSVTVVSGNFKDQLGTVLSVNFDKNEATIEITFMGQQVEMTVATNEIEKLLQ